MKRILILSLFGISCHVFSQFAIKGSVKNENGEPLVGANVLIEGTYRGCIASSDGSFMLNELKQGDYELIVSYIGYESQKKLVNVQQDINADFVLKSSSIISEEVIVKGIRAEDKTPSTSSFVDKDELKKENLGKDVPYLLSMQPSVMISSDAGNGVGYSNMTIRGVDSKQINVTINGIPLNDAESQGVFWVDIPDIAGSTEGIQIQRGVGTSTNGAGAFGGSININTNNISKNPFFEANSAIGTFNTSKYSATVGTGLINDHWFFEGKYGQTKSDGYRDRSWSDLRSYFFQGGYYGNNSILKAIIFGGREETYQAWYSVSQDDINTYGRTFNPAGAIYNDDYSIKDYYNNFIDHYDQDHYQLHWLKQLTPSLSFNTAVHYTYGRGYYEEYMQEEFLQYYPMSFYNLDTVFTANDTITWSDVVRRLWLDNDFFGTTWSLNYITNKIEIYFGGAYNKFGNGKHFGEVIWARYASNSLPGDEFYKNISNKTDFNSYLKILYSPFNNLNIYSDLQYRNIEYSAKGLDREWTNGDNYININKNYNFFNPKFGLNYQAKYMEYYASYAIAHREPNRSDFLDAPEGIEPKPEKLADTELGIKSKYGIYTSELVLYNMQYTNQLILTGKLNEVGTPIRKNVGESFRRGMEFSIMAAPLSVLNVEGNITFSKNSTSYNTFNSEDSSFINYKNVDIAYSPTLLVNGIVIYKPVKSLETKITFKYTGDQYVDNTENSSLKLPAYSNMDFSVNYTLNPEHFGEIAVYFNIYNLLDKEYSSYGVVRWDGSLGLFPQAGQHYLAGITVRF